MTIEHLSDKDITIRDKWGEGPVCVEVIPASVTLPANPDRTRCFALDPKGNRKREVPVTKVYNVILIGVALFGCSMSTKTEQVTKTWDEVGHSIYSEIKHGIPAYEGEKIAYKRDGKFLLNVSLETPAKESD